MNYVIFAHFRGFGCLVFTLLLNKNAVFRVKITQLKIASNPFAKGFRDSEADQQFRSLKIMMSNICIME